MMLGRQCLYFNPHGEPMGLFNEDPTGGLIRATTTAELEAQLRCACNTPAKPPGETTAHFLEFHCGPRDGRAAERCAAALTVLAGGGSPHRYPNWRRGVDRLTSRLTARCSRLLGRPQRRVG